MSAVSPLDDGMDATAQVLSVGGTTGMVNMDPLVPVELLVDLPGLPPRPVATTVVVPLAQLGRLTTGATLPVRVSTSDTSHVAVEWGKTA